MPQEKKSLTRFYFLYYLIYVATSLIDFLFWGGLIGSYAIVKVMNHAKCPSGEIGLRSD